MKSKLINIYGWYGAIAIILAYTLVSFSVVSAENIWYQVLNGTGALGIVVNSFFKKDYQPGVLNTVWAIIAITAIIRLAF